MDFVSCQGEVQVPDGVEGHMTTPFHLIFWQTPPLKYGKGPLLPASWESRTQNEAGKIQRPKPLSVKAVPSESRKAADQAE